MFDERTGVRTDCNINTTLSRVDHGPDLVLDSRARTALTALSCNNPGLIISATGTAVESGGARTGTAI